MLFKKVATDTLLPKFTDSQTVGSGIKKIERKPSSSLPITPLEPIQINSLSTDIQKTLEWKPSPIPIKLLYKKQLFLRNKKQLFLRISEIIDQLMTEENLFKEIDKGKLRETISTILNEVSIRWEEISEEELIKRIRQILVLRAMSGILNELTPEQMEIFNEVTKRRKHSI